MVPDNSRQRRALLLTRHDEGRQNRQHRAVHGHRHRHFGEGNTVEEDLHVLDTVDRHARLAHVAGHARVVGVVAAVRRQIEGHAEALLPGGQVAAVKGVTLLGRGKARVLPDGPGPGGVHGGAWPARVRRQARQPGIEVLGVGGRVEGLEGQPLGSQAAERLGTLAAQVFAGERFPVTQVPVTEVPVVGTGSGLGRVGHGCLLL